MIRRPRIAQAAVAVALLAGAATVTAAPAQAVTQSASMYQYCLWSPGAPDFTTSVRAFGSSTSYSVFSVYRDGVKVAAFGAPRPGWWLEGVPAGDHTYEVRNAAGTTTLATLGPVTGGTCTPQV